MEKDVYGEMRAFDLAMMPNPNIPTYKKEHSIRKGRYIKDGYLVHLSEGRIKRDLLNVLKNIANKKLEEKIV